MDSINPEDTRALNEYFREHVYDSTKSFGWIQLGDRMMEKSVFLFPFALLAFAACIVHEQAWQLWHWVKYKRTPQGSYARRRW